MTWQQVFDWCRMVNAEGLGLAAFCALSYRATVGLLEQKITYRPLFVLFVAYVLNQWVGAVVGAHRGTPATFLSCTALLLNIALIAICLFFPGPLRKHDSTV